jgi:DNA-directed RNA polymerase subunit RPC12/RpoP
MKDKNEHISIWIIEQMREENRIRLQKEKALKIQAEKHLCSKCKKGFPEPKIIQYYACPHCESKYEVEEEKSCQHWFGFLAQKDSSQSIPSECVECENVLECILGNQITENAVSQIKKWY